MVCTQRSNSATSARRLGRSAGNTVRAAVLYEQPLVYTTCNQDGVCVPVLVDGHVGRSSSLGSSAGEVGWSGLRKCYHVLDPCQPIAGVHRGRRAGYVQALAGDGQGVWLAGVAAPACPRALCCMRQPRVLSLLCLLLGSVCGLVWRRGLMLVSGGVGGHERFDLLLYPLHFGEHRAVVLCVHIGRWYGAVKPCAMVG